jgi:hypothetical protein
MYSPLSYQPHVLLSVLPDCRYARCSRNYRRSAEYKPRNSCPIEFPSPLAELPGSVSLSFPEPFDEAQGERKRGNKRKFPFMLRPVEAFLHFFRAPHLHQIFLISDQLCFFTQSRITVLVSSGACQKNPWDWSLSTFSSAPGIRFNSTSDCAM